MASFLEFVWHYLPELLKGTRYTLLIWVVGVSGGFIFGWLLAIGRVYGNRFLRPLAIAYIELFRGTPMLAQMFIIYMGLPEIGIVLSPLWAAVWAIGLNTSAYQAEYFRGGISAIRSGQMTAARAIGLSRRKAIFYVILPQAFRIALPQWLNEVILELKYTSIAFAIGVMELMGAAKHIGSTTFSYFQIFLAAALIYLVVVNILMSIFDVVEKRYALRQ